MTPEHRCGVRGFADSGDKCPGCVAENRHPAPETRPPTRREAEIERFRPWLLRQIEACAQRAVNDDRKKSREYHSQMRMVLLGILAEYDRREAADLLREEGESPAPNAHYYGEPLHVAVEDGALVIRIGVQTLAHAASYSEWANPYDDESGDYVRMFAITDAVGFANDVRRMLLQEREDGSSMLSDVLDKAMEAAVDDGSEHCEYEQRILHGQTSPLETWASRVDPVPPPPPPGRTERLTPNDRSDA